MFVKFEQFAKQRNKGKGVVVDLSGLHNKRVRVNNKRNAEGTVINGTYERSLVDFGTERAWYDNKRLWIEVGKIAQSNSKSAFGT